MGKTNFALNKIVQMDCIEGMALMEEESVDLIVTDPPYNTGMKAKEGDFTGKKVRLDKFFNDDFTEDEYWRLALNTSMGMYRILKNNKAGYLFINWKSLGIWQKALNIAGFDIKNVIVWDKVVHGLNYQNYAYTHEFIIFFVKGKFFPNNKPGDFYKDIWHIKRKMNNGLKFGESDHETQKATEVIRNPILHGSNAGEIVLDPFMGSGTTAIVAKQLGRAFLGFEMEEKYINDAMHKLEQETLEI